MPPLARRGASLLAPRPIAAARPGRAVHDVENLPRGAGEGEAVAVGRHDVGDAVEQDALVVGRAGQGGAQVGYFLRFGREPALQQEDADFGSVIGFNRQNTGRSRQHGLVVQQRRRPVIGGDADILEDERAEQEGVFAGKRIEAVAKAGGLGQRVEARGQVDSWLRDRLLGEDAAEEADVVQLVLRDLLGVLLDGGGVEADRPAARDAALDALAVGVRVGEARAHGGAEVELGFQVFQVEREVQHGGIVVPHRLGRRARDRQAGDGHCAEGQCAEAGAAQQAPPLQPRRFGRVV